MPSAHIIRDCPIKRTPRVQQLEGMFDLEASSKSCVEFEVDLPLPETWNIGLIVGPSGCGKTTIAKELWPQDIVAQEWGGASVIDHFPAKVGIKEITGLLSSVGFSSPPSWLRPYSVLSTGEQFRVSIARALAESRELCVFDEFTSTVDRTVAQIGSAAVAKAIRKRDKKIIALSCHYDILPWLAPDWVYEPQLNKFYLGDWLQRPAVKLEVKRVSRLLWELFRRHHYLNTHLNQSAQCFGAFYEQRPVAFAAVLHFPHARADNIKREHRLVCLPDFQGIGIGNALSDFIGSLCRALGFRYQSTTSHPAMIAARHRSNDWRCARALHRLVSSSMTNTLTSGPISQRRGKVTRFSACFEYIGQALDPEQARGLWEDVLPIK